MTKADKKLHNLKYWRNILGLTQSDISVLLGCTPSNYSQKELGKIDIGRLEMLLIQNAFNKMLREREMKELKLDDIFLTKELQIM